MKGLVIAVAVACFGVQSALAASPKVESAIKTFKEIGSDPARTKTFCELVQTMDAAGEKDDAESDAKIAALTKQLGPDFEAAWTAADDLDENSEDGEAYSAAMDDLSGKCPQ